MGKRNSGGKQAQDRMLKQLSAKKNAKDVKKVIDLSKKSVTRGELFNVQNAFHVKMDAALMGVAAVADILVKNKICTYEQFKESKKGMSDILTFIRKTMGEADKALGAKATPDDTGVFIYDKAVAFGVDKDVLVNLFGIKPSASRIIKPAQVKNIIIPR